MRRHYRAIIDIGLLALLVSALYLPFLGNPLVFDDHGYFAGADFAERALSPIGPWRRQPAIFSIALVEVLSGRIEVHRLVGLAAHLACCVCLYALIHALAGLASPAQASQRGLRWAALGATALFALHPMAVYGAGYLAQRPTVFATLFVLLALVFYVRGLRTASYSGALVAGVFYSLAVLSKENAFPAAACAVGLLVLGEVPWRFAWRYAALNLAVSAPAAVCMLFLSKLVIGQTFEPGFATVAAQAASEAPRASSVIGSPWIASMLVQLGLFWKYIDLWLLPRTSAMSIDVRIDFAEYWSIAWLTFAAFIAFAALAVYLLRRRGSAGVAGFGLLYFWLMFLVEFTAVRFQEPFVLYRSYLWAPGLAIAASSVLTRVAWRPVALAAGLPVLALITWQAHDRLQTLSSGLALWQDAAAKLPGTPVPGGHRPLYEFGRELFAAGRTDEAARVVEKCLALYPRTGECQMARAALYMEAGEDRRALPHLEKAIALLPDPTHARLMVGVALEDLGCYDEAKALYRDLVSHGFVGAKYYIERLEEPGKGLLAPRARRPPERGHAECATLRGQAGSF